MMFRRLGMECARTEAFDLLDEFGVESADHVQIEGFARRLGVDLVEAPLHGAQAQLLVCAGGARIVLSDQLTDPADRNWAIGHELGHFVLRHDSVPAAELPPARCRAHRRYRRYLELEANGFAMAVLMPTEELAQVCDALPMTLDPAVQLARRCSVPLAAAAFRITEVTYRICAAVLSKDGTIRMVSPSLRFLALYGRAVALGRRLGHESLAGRFFAKGTTCTEPQLVPAAAWLDGYADNASMQEHSVVLGVSDVVLTMLWAPSEPPVPRDVGLTLEKMTRARDYVLGELEEPPHE